MNTKYILILVIALIVSSCLQDEDYYIEPSPMFTIATENGEASADIFEKVEITITGEGNRMVLFTGDENHVLDSVGKNPLNSGLYVRNGDVVRYNYTSRGKFTVSLLSSGFNDNGSNLSRNSYSQEIVITDSEGRNNLKEIKFRADGGVVTYVTNSKLKNIEGINLPSSKLEQTMVVPNQIADDGNYYVPVYCEFRQGREKDDEFHYAQHVIEIPDLRSGFNYKINDVDYTVPTLRRYYRDTDNFFFNNISVDYSPETNPADITSHQVYILPIPEFKSMTFRTQSGSKIDDIKTEKQNPFFGTITPVYNEFFPDLLDMHKFYAPIEYSATQAGEMTSVKLEFEHRLPAKNVEVFYDGEKLTGDGTDTKLLDFSSGMVQLKLVYTDELFASQVEDVTKVQAVAYVDVYAFQE